MKILVIDDNDIDRWITERIILSTYPDYQIFQAGTVREAFYLLQTKKIPDIVLLDLHMMPDSGFVFLDHMPCASMPYIPVVILTNSLNPSDNKRAWQHPWVVDYLDKPLSKKSFSQMLKNLSGKKVP